MPPWTKLIDGVLRTGLRQVKLSELENDIGAGGGGGVTVRNSGFDTGTRGAINFLPGTNVLVTTADDSANDEVEVTIESGITVQEEGVALSGRGYTLNFTGAGATASGTGATKTINIPGGGSGVTVRDAGADVGTRAAVNFIEGPDVTLTFADDPTNGEVEVTVGVATGAFASIHVQTATPGTPATDDFWLDSDDGRRRIYHYNGSVFQETNRPLEAIGVALSDTTTAITTGTAKESIRMPYPFVVTEVRASLKGASSSGVVTVDINEAGVSILSTLLTIDANEKTSVTAAAAPVISDSALADDAEITFDIDTAGTGATGLKVWIIGYRPV